MSGDLKELWTIPVRVIRSFEHRNIRYLVIKDVSPQYLVKELKAIIMTKLKESPSFPPPVRNYAYDTIKIEHFPHKSKTTDPVINTEDDTLILPDEKTLLESHMINETELSFFKLEDYIRYKTSKHSDV
uniref:Uncharacterized protein n=1 Tax=Ornithodoros turicata TaxID=34597 RepID=A0A2R5LFR6_9ACAR